MSTSLTDMLERHHLFHVEILFFLEAARDERTVRFRDEIPSVEEHWRTRLGTSAVNVCKVVIEQVPPVGTLCLTHYSLVEQVELSPATMNLPVLTTLWIEANMIVSIYPRQLG